MTATYTHKESGGRFVEVNGYAGTGPLEGQQLVVYHDLDRDVMSATTAEDWRQHWRAIAKDDCSVCMGTGHDHIKGNREKPCGGCFGLGKVREDGETPKDRWEVAEVALGIIQRQQQELEQRCRAMAVPGVRAAIQAAKEAAIVESVGRQEQEWRKGAGYGPGGQRHTGD